VGSVCVVQDWKLELSFIKGSDWKSGMACFVQNHAFVFAFRCSPCMYIHIRLCNKSCPLLVQDIKLTCHEMSLGFLNFNTPIHAGSSIGVLIERWMS
jgi:hypothetical protein